MSSLFGMDFFARLKASFSNGTSGFNGLELKILRETMVLLDSADRANLQRRIDQINLVQRLAGGEEVNCYQMKNGKAVVDTSTAVRHETGETVLATVSISAGPGIQVNGKIWLVDGRFFSMEFDKPTEHLIDMDSGALAVSVVLSQ